jgi:hypothetical protein
VGPPTLEKNLRCPVNIDMTNGYIIIGVGHHGVACGSIDAYGVE